VGGDHDRVDATRNRREVGIAWVTFDRRGVGIDGEDLVAAAAKALVHDVPAVARGVA
jgi:hypothetical protein